MNTSGKNKIEFSKYLSKQKYCIIHDVGERHGNIVDLSKLFDRLPFEMQYGVLLAYYRRLKIFPDVIDPNDSIGKMGENDDYHSIVQTEDKYFPIDFHDSWEEAMKAAFKEADQIRNEQLN